MQGTNVKKIAVVLKATYCIGNNVEILFAWQVKTPRFLCCSLDHDHMNSVHIERIFSAKIITSGLM